MEIRHRSIIGLAFSVDMRLLLLTRKPDTSIVTGFNGLQLLNETTNSAMCRIFFRATGISSESNSWRNLGGVPNLLYTNQLPIHHAQGDLLYWVPALDVTSNNWISVSVRTRVAQAAADAVIRKTCKVYQSDNFGR